MTRQRRRNKAARRWLLWQVLHLVLAGALLAIFFTGAFVSAALSPLTFYQGLILFVSGWLAAFQSADWVAYIQIKMEGDDDDDE